MGFLNKIKKAFKKTVKKALSGVTDNKPDKVTPDAQLGPSGDAGARVVRRNAANRTRRGSRGRDSTIITARSEIGSRTLLG